MKKANGNNYVSYRWLLTTVIASAASILAIVGAIANATFYSKPAGAAVEQKVEGVVDQVNELKLITTEVRQDVKILLARKK